LLFFLLVYQLKLVTTSKIRKRFAVLSFGLPAKAGDHYANKQKNKVL